MKPLEKLVIENGCFSYGKDRTIFRQLALELPLPVDRGRIVAIMGPSGSGKTTLLRIIAGAQSLDCGSITRDWKGELAYLPQGEILFEHLTPSDNVNFFSRIQRLSGLYEEKRVDLLATALGMEKILAQKSITTMSGGERQRLSLIRSLSIKPRVLLLDEPCAGLDAPLRRDFLFRFRTIVDAFKMLTLYVTHHSDEALFIADDILHFEFCEGSTEVKIKLQSVHEATHLPPSPYIAKLLSHEPLNELFVTIHAGEVRTREGDLLGRVESQAVKTCGTLVFNSSVISMSPGPDGMSIKHLGGNPNFEFYSSTAGSATLVARQPPTCAPQRLKLRGSVLFYPSPLGAPLQLIITG